MLCSKDSDEREYANFLAWARQVFPEEVFAALPKWEQVEGWRGHMIAVMDYEASAGGTADLPMWNEGYPYWWKMSNVRLLDKPYAVRGNVGMWKVS